jgi:hypothetical protein
MLARSGDLLSRPQGSAPRCPRVGHAGVERCDPSGTGRDTQGQCANRSPGRMFVAHTRVAIRQEASAQFPPSGPGRPASEREAGIGVARWPTWRAQPCTAQPSILEPAATNPATSGPQIRSLPWVPGELHIRRQASRAARRVQDVAEGEERARTKVGLRGTWRATAGLVIASKPTTDLGTGIGADVSDITLRGYPGRWI